MKTKIKKIKPSTLRRKCLQLWSYIVRERAMFKCEYCGSDKFLQAHHIIGKRFKPTMFWVTNGICLCAKCHKWGIGFSAHENPIKLAEHLKENRPTDYNHLKHLLPYPRPSDNKMDYGEELKRLEEYRLGFTSIHRMEEYRLGNVDKDKKLLCKRRKART